MLAGKLRPNKVPERLWQYISGFYYEVAGV